MQALTKPIHDGTDATKLHNLRSQIWEIGKTSLFLILFFVVAGAFAGILEFHLNLWNAYEFVRNHGKTVLYVVLFAAYGQISFQSFAMAWPYRHLSVKISTWTQEQYHRERDLVRRLSHIPGMQLQVLRKRVGVEIDILKQVSLVGMLVSATGNLGQLHFGSEQILQDLFIGIIVILLCSMTLIRQYSRLAFVLECAENAYTSGK
jgi:hypothetical protein